MFHLVARAVPGTLLFRTHHEARVLWDRVVAAAPGLAALCLMPDHVHLQHVRDVHRALGAALSGFARWRNARRSEQGRMILSMPTPEWLADDQKVRRSIRYIHLNPCRAGLVRDPLEWPWSTHRDAVGLVAWPVVPEHRSPEEFHAYVSSDPSASVQGTALPFGEARAGAGPDLEQVLVAVSAATRTPVDDLRRRGPARTLLVRLARALTDASSFEIAATASVDLRTVQRAEARDDAIARRVARILGDRRFPGLDSRDLRLDPRWTRYRTRR